MANQQLVEFIRERQKTGVDKVEIKKELSSVGWPEKDIEEGFLEISPVTRPSLSPLPPVPQVDQAPASSWEEVPSADKTPSSSVYKPSITFAPTEPPHTKNRSGMWVGIVLICLVVIIGGATTYAYITKSWPFSNPPYTEDNLMSGLLSSYERINSSAYSFSGSLNIGARDTDAVPSKIYLKELGEMFSILPNDVSGSTSISVATDWSKPNADWKFNISATSDLGDIKYEIDVDALRKNGIYYFKINDFPSVILMFIDASGTLKGKWIKVDINTASSSSNSSYNALSSLTSELPNFEKTYKENVQQFKDALAKTAKIADEEHLLSLKNTPKSEKVDGRNLYRYDLKINKSAIIPFYKRYISEVISPYSKEFGMPPVLSEEYLTYLESPEFDELIDFYDKNTSLSLFVDTEGFPAIVSYKLRFVPSDSATQFKDKQINLVLNLAVSDINKPINIEEPRDSKPIQDLMDESMLGSIQVRGRDARRISDLRQIQNALEVYFNTCNHYPPTFNHIVDSQSDCGGKQISVVQIPKDPTGSSYGYCLVSPDKYTLGAKLEDTANSRLIQQNTLTFPCAPLVEANTNGDPITLSCDDGINGSGVLCLTL